MDATPASNGSGFDAALKALEQLDAIPVTSSPVTPAAGSPAPSVLAFDDAPEEDEAASVEPASGAGAATLTVEPLEVQEAVREPEVPEKAGAERDSVKFLAEEPQDAGPADSSVAPAPAPIAVASPVGRLGKAAIGLGLFSSVLSAAGLIVAERTIMSAELVIADAREKQRQIDHATRLIKELERLREKQTQLLAQQQAQTASAPVTSSELQHRMEALQAGLLARDPVNKVVEAVNSDKAENNARFYELGMKMARIEAFMESRRK